MLEPDGRAALSEQLRPPAGFDLLHAVGTTFTLDLTSALSVPLSFAGHHVRETDDPIAILDAVRRAADRVDLFAQAGQVAVPRQASDLVAFLEPMVHPVVAPQRGALFHPKVWVLEYGRGEERSYRFLCSSRNLTGDRSWDVMVRLDGTRSTSATPMENGAEIANLLRALPGMAVIPLAGERVDRIRALANRMVGVEWESPADVREMVLHALGVGSPSRLEFGGKRHLVISPFLSDSGVALVSERSKEKIQVISRAESLEALRPETLANISGFVLDEAARDTEERDDDPLVGLHAKVVALDRQSGSRVFIGSANATGAAHSGNVEFLVELVGPQPRVGVDALFGDTSALRGLVIPYEAIGGAQPSEKEKADLALEVALRGLAGIRLRNTVIPAGDTFTITIEPLEPVRMDAEFVSAVQLLTRPGNSAPLPQEVNSRAEFSGLLLTDVTPFVVLRIRDDRGEERSTVVRAELLGDLPHRRDAVLARQIDSPQKFLQFLLLLLSLGGADLGRSLLGAAGGTGEWTGDGGGVFESLVTALGARSGALDDLGRLIERLRADNPAVLPPGFDELWSSIWAAHIDLSAVAS